MPFKKKKKTPQADHGAMSAAEKKKALIDELIQGTNSESITSKRSVESLYSPQPHFFKYFVPKTIRRSPLVNRGYWFRLHAIETSIHSFLCRPHDGKRKVIINLGCGSDVLPWQCGQKYSSICGWDAGTKAIQEKTLFIDIDYPDMIQKKSKIVTGIPELASLLGDSYTLPEDKKTGVLLSSEKYAQIACDLRQLAKVQSLVNSVTNLPSSHVLFVAEVSITYMDNPSADAVIKWASTLPSAEFMLLEQLLPDTENHPFAHNMLYHFNKLSTTLHSVHRYPTLSAQEDRFNALGWSHVRAQNLWQAWSNPFLTSLKVRKGLDSIEPFDEWEELAVFGTHYVLVNASNASPVERESEPRPDFNIDIDQTPVLPISTTFIPAPGTQCLRHHGSAVISGDSIISILGQGVNARCNTADVYGPDDLAWTRGPSPRVCATTTVLPSGTLLTGGRTSPTRALDSSYLLTSRGWSEVAPLPVSLYRHAAVAVGDNALIYGGKTDAVTINDQAFLFINGHWEFVEQTGDIPAPRFGATFGTFSPSRGFLAGGITANGTVDASVWTWELSKTTLQFKKPCAPGLLSRFGALCLPIPSGTLVIGGVIGEVIVPSASEILLVKEGNSKLSVTVLRDASISGNGQRPFWIGAAGVVRGDVVEIIGGGATCYAMGTYWSPGRYSFVLPGSDSKNVLEKYKGTVIIDAIKEQQRDISLNK